MKKYLYFAIGFCFCASIVGVLVFNATSTSGVTQIEDYYQKIRDGLAEANLPPENSLSLINAAPDNLSNFLNTRAGVQLNSTNKDVLRNAEQSFWNNSKRVDAAVLSQIISEIAIERIPTLSNSEIAQITESSRPFNAPNLPAAFALGRQRIVLRSSGRGQMPATEFNTELTGLRDGGIQSKVAQNLIRVAISNEVNRRVDVLSKADPQFFAGTSSRMTPTQALLVSYSVVADDPLTHDQAGLVLHMQRVHQVSSQNGSVSFPSPQGFKAYGDNGYIHSSPASIFLNDTSVARLLTLIQERGN